MKLRKINIAGIIAYVGGSAAAYFSPGIPPITGIIVAIVLYIVADLLLKAVGAPQDHEIVTSEGGGNG